MPRFVVPVVLLLLSSCTARSPPPASNAGTGKAVTFENLDLVAGQPGGAGWVDGPATAAHFSDPFTLATDGERLFLTDGTTIRTIDPVSHDVDTLAGTYGVTAARTAPVRRRASTSLPA